MYKARVYLPNGDDKEQGYHRVGEDKEQPCLEWGLHLVLNVLIATMCILSFELTDIVKDQNGDLKVGVLAMLLGQILLRATFFALPLFLTLESQQSLSRHRLFYYAALAFLLADTIASTFAIAAPLIVLGTT